MSTSNSEPDFVCSESLDPLFLEWLSSGRGSGRLVENGGQNSGDRVKGVHGEQTDAVENSERVSAPPQCEHPGVEEQFSVEWTTESSCEEAKQTSSLGLSDVSLSEDRGQCIRGQREQIDAVENSQRSAVPLQTEQTGSEGLSVEVTKEAFYDERSDEETQITSSNNSLSSEEEEERDCLEVGGSRCRYSRCLEAYARIVLKLHSWINNKWLIPMVTHVVLNPMLYIVIVLSISFAIPGFAVATGSVTTEVVVDKMALSQQSYPIRQQNWIQETFKLERYTQVLIHDSGRSVLTYEAVQRAFQLLDGIVGTESYAEICETQKRCQVGSVTRFWDSREDFESMREEAISASELDRAVRLGLSSSTLADGRPVTRSLFFGRPETANSTSQDQRETVPDELLYAASLRFILSADFSNKAEEEEIKYMEEAFGHVVENLQKQFAEEGSALKIEISARRIEDNELEGPIFDDMPLVYGTFAIMAVFTMLAFSRFGRNKKGQRFVDSSALLGLGAVVTVALSMVTGYGICALCGYPLTMLTQLLPFVLLGIGLDDAFVIVGTFEVTDKKLSIEKRFQKMTEFAGLSILVTSLTDCTAFALGAALTTMPSLRWFAFYASMSILIDFLYQLTFFIALMALDEKRKALERYDCLFCLKAPMAKLSVESFDACTTKTEKKESWQTRAMRAYARFLFKPLTKVAVLLGFFGLFGYLAYSASTVAVRFDMTELMADDSPITAYINADLNYFQKDGGASLVSHVYFHDLNQSSALVRQEMHDFVQDLYDLGYAEEFPARLWTKDFEAFVASRSDLSDLPFDMQLDAFLSIDAFKSLYAKDIVFDEEGSILASRVGMTLDVGRYDTVRQVDLLMDQRKATTENPVNAENPPPKSGVDRMWLFFSEFPLYYHYSILTSELVSAIVMELVAIAIIAACFFPHPSGTVLSVVVVAMVNVELVGILPIAGFYFNTLTFALLIMAIGLVIDYCLHVIDAYLRVPLHHCYCRRKRMEEALVEIGWPVMLGAFSTLLGVMALSLSESAVFRTFFIMFLSMVLLGAGHGLIFIPVVLSMCGPKKDVIAYST